MCYFITGIYSGPVTLEEINAAAGKYDLQFEPCDNRFVREQLARDEIYVSKLADICDCDTPLGSVRRAAGHEENVGKTALAVRKLRSKGWGEAKIQRYLESKQQMQDRAADSETRQLAQSRALMRSWLNYFEALFQTTATRTFGLLLHFYSKGPDNEHLRLLSRRTIPLPDLTEDTLLMMEDDVLYVFTRR